LVKTLVEFNEKVGKDGPWENSHILVEFYMTHCPWCERFTNKWDILVKEFTEKYNTGEGNENKVIFMMVNGPDNHELASRYRAEGYPEFVYLAPGKKGLKAKRFDGGRNSEDEMRKFFNKMIEKHVKLESLTEGSSIKDKIKETSEETASNATNTTEPVPPPISHNLDAGDNSTAGAE